MKSLNFTGQILIDTAQASRIENRNKSLALLEQSKNNLLAQNIECAKEQIMVCYELTLKSTRDAFIAVSGLEPLVLNEALDSVNHNKLSLISNKLYNLYCDFFRLYPVIECLPNVISYRKFQLCMILVKLTSIRLDLQGTL